MMRGPRLAALLLVLAVAAVYAPVRAHDFVSYDDEQYLLANPHLAHGLDPGQAAWFFTHPYAANWHPLTWLSHMLDVELFGLAPGPHHLVNVALHALNAVLVLCLARELLAGTWAAGLAAALFALHPLRVESVAWAAERKDVLCAALFLGALLAWLGHARRPSAGRYLGVLALFALALLAKPMAVTFPLVVLLLDVGPLARWDCGCGVPAASPYPGRSGRALLLEKLPLLALAGAAAAVTLVVQAQAGATSSSASLGLDLRALNALRSLAVYLGQSVFPGGLSVFYPHAALLEPEPARALLPGALLGAALLVGLLALVWRLRRAAPVVGFGIGTFLVTLLPVIGLVQVGTQAHADRYTYLPSVGLALALAGSALALGAGRARWSVALGLAATLALAVQARRQVAVWRDTRTLFAHALALDARNPLAHTKLGEVALDEGDEPAARAAFLRALELDPRDAHVLVKLGLCHLAAGELEAAEARLQQALALDPGRPDALLNLGVVALERGDLASARTRLAAALARAPDDPDVHFDLGLLAQREGDAAAAERAFREALSLDERHLDAWSNLAQVLLAARRTDEAVQAFERVVAAAPDDPVAHFNLGVARRQRGDRAGASGAFRRALALDPGFTLASEALHALEAGE
jgi:protein O-mannosyl-transferase